MHYGRFFTGELRHADFCIIQHNQKMLNNTPEHKLVRGTIMFTPCY